MKIKRMAGRVGMVNEKAFSNIMNSIQDFLNRNRRGEITLFITSDGGSPSVGLGFYDTMRALGANLTTVAAGNVNSSAVLIWLAGKRRYVTQHSQMILHPGKQKTGKGGESETEMACSLASLKLDEHYYNQVLADASGGKVSVSRAEIWNKKNTVLSPNDLLKFGLAHKIIKC